MKLDDLGWWDLAKGLTVVVLLVLTVGTIRSCGMLDAAQARVAELQAEKDSLRQANESLLSARDSLDERVGELVVAVDRADREAHRHRAVTDSLLAVQDSIALALELPITEADSTYAELATELVAAVDRTQFQGLVTRTLAASDRRVETRDNRIRWLETSRLQLNRRLAIERETCTRQIATRDSTIVVLRNRRTVADSLVSNCEQRLQRANDQVRELERALDPGLFVALRQNAGVFGTGLGAGALIAAVLSASF